MLQKIITNGLEKLGGSACPDPDRIVINDDNVLNYHGVHACGAACASTCYLLDGAWYNNQHTAVQLQLLHLFGAAAHPTRDRRSQLARFGVWALSLRNEQLPISGVPCSMVRQSYNTRHTT